MTAACPPRTRPPAAAADWALFLDVDGCLLDFADRPGGVMVPEPLLATLHALQDRLAGALALVSGRPIAGIDALFAPLRLPVAGLHGLEWRNGVRRSPPLQPPPALARVRSEAQALAMAQPGVEIEDKGASLALHWRRIPGAASALRAFASAVLPRLPGYRLQPGDHVIELRPADGDKGAALRTLMAQPPFIGRTPVFAGDDLTDESAFAVVNAAGGISVLVGGREPSAARYALHGPAAVRGWLHDAAAALVPAHKAAAK